MGDVAKASPPSDVAPATPARNGWRKRGRRASAWRGAEWLRENSKLQSVALCRLTPVDDHLGTRVVVGPEGASFGGLKKCSSPWACPLCAASLARTRVEYASTAAESWCAAGNTVAMVTLTMRHTASDDLVKLFEANSKAWSSVRQSAAVRKATTLEGLAATASKTEVTWGRNGWHVHRHALAFFEGDDPAAPDRWAEAAFPVWQRALKRLGLEPDGEHGIDVKIVRAGRAVEDVAAYVAKDGSPLEALSAALEVAGGAVGKLGAGGNVSTWQILARAVVGDGQAAALWGEWEVASKGRRAMVWSKGAAKTLGLDDEPDELVADDAEPESRAVMAIHPDEWKRLRRTRKVNRLLDAAEDGYAAGLGSGRDPYLVAQIAVAVVLDSWGVPRGAVLPINRVDAPDPPPALGPPAPQQLGFWGRAL
jgi:hypothetical protein